MRDLRARQTTRNIRDTALAGFGVGVVLPGDRKRFFLHGRHEGRRMWKISGDPADMTVAEVRDRARGLPTSLRSGRPDRETPFETAAEEAFRRHARQWKPSTLSVNRNHLDRNILPRFAGRPIADIVPRDMRDRFLCDAEIARLGRALRGASPGVAIIRLLAPTRCRSSEIATDPAASVLPNRRPRLTRFLPLDEAR